MKKNRMPGIRILHEDEDVIVVEKAAGVLAQEVDGAYSVEGALTDYVRKGQWKSARRVYLVHRLDGRTSGVMMVAKNERAQTWLRDHWNEVTTKIYLARVEGVLNPKFGKLARTEWRVVAEPGMKPRGRRPSSTSVEVTLKSGRKNQIRVHFAEAGHPVVGDAKYGHGRRGDVLCLHAWKLAFQHPRTGELLSFTSAPPTWWKVLVEMSPHPPSD